MLYTHINDYYSVLKLKQKEILLYATRWMNLEDITVGAKNQSLKGINSAWFYLYKKLMGFRTYYPKTWPTGILKFLHWRSLRKQQKQECYSDSFSSPFFPEIVHKNPHVGGCPPYTQRKGTYLSLKTKEHKEES